MSDDVLDRLGRLEAAVRGAAEALARLRAENAELRGDNAQLREDVERLRREVARLGAERQQVVSQIDVILGDIAKLELGPGPGR